MRILPEPGADNKLAWARLIVGVIVIIVGVFTQFDITVEQEVTKPKVVRVEVAQAKLVKKKGTIPEADCYAMRKQVGKADRTDFIDTYGAPDDDDDASWIYYPLTEHKNRNCVLHFDSVDNKLVQITIDLTDPYYG